MTAALTSRVDTPEYQARIMAMQAVYWALGIHDPDFVARFGKPAATYKVLQAKAAWAVLSFQVVRADDPGLQAAEKAAAQQLAGPRRYAINVYRWGKETPDPLDIHISLVEVLEQARLAFPATPY